jgi:iron complex outermembrane receptor protein
MKKLLLMSTIVLCALYTYAQNTFKAVLRDEKTKAVLSAASCYIEKLKKGASTDTNGSVIITDIPNGKFEIEFTFTGYEEKQKEFSFPVADTIYEIDLEAKEQELEEVTVQTTRSNRTIKDIPTRIEVLAADELDEKGTMKPGDIKMLLNESTGIATQQTSAVSGNANIRIQGLDGRYTQILKDGMPLYNNFSGGLSIMQIAPLDLKQVEFIKGSASTLYGGGAIAGLVNLISKTPEDKREFTVLLNATSAKGFDASEFYSQKWKSIGTTIFSSYNFNGPYDPADIGLTAIPRTKRYTVNPKLFFYFNKKTSAWFGINTIYEDRLGGDLNVINGKADSIHQYFEHSQSFRFSTQLSFTHQINNQSKISFKNAVGFFNRKLLMPSSSFHGNEISSFSEVNYSYTKEKSEWVAGLNVWTDDFHPLDTTTLQYHLNTAGGFVQNTFKASNWFILETGLRIDYNTPHTLDKLNGFFILPRINALFKINPHWTSRVGGGLGYKMPSPFNEDAEERGYENIQPISFNTSYAEKSYGGNADINYRIHTGDYSLSMNQLFFYTYLNKPLILNGDAFVNANGHIDTKGAETNFRVTHDDLTFYLGYTYTNARQHFNGENSWLPLAARHRMNATLTYEKEDKFRTGIEGYYVSRQELSDGTIGKDYMIFGFLFEKIWERINVYVNCEDLTDRRQTRWDTIYTGTITNPTFKDIYAPLDGVVVNAGIKLKL